MHVAYSVVFGSSGWLRWERGGGGRFRGCAGVGCSGAPAGARPYVRGFVPVAARFALTTGYPLLAPPARESGGRDLLHAPEARVEGSRW